MATAAQEQVIDQFEQGGTWVDAAERFAATYWREPRKVDRATVLGYGPYEGTFSVKDGLRRYRVKRGPATPWIITVIDPQEAR